MRIGSPAPSPPVIQKWSMFAGTRSISAANAIGLPARWARSPWWSPGKPRDVCCRRRCCKRLRGRRERAVAFVDVNGLADEGHTQILPPFAGRKFARGLDRFAERFDPLGFFFHRLDQNAAVEFLRRFETKNVQNGRRDVDIGAG